MNFRLIVCLALATVALCQTETTAGTSATTMAETTQKETTMAQSTMAPTTMAPTTMAPTTTMDNTTTTKMADTTTVAMTTTEKPVKNQFAVKNENGTYCLVVDVYGYMNISVLCPGETNWMNIEVRSDDGAMASGHCGEDVDELMIKKANEYEVMMAFQLKGTYYQLVNVSVDVDMAKCKEMGTKDGLSDLRAPTANVYRCNAERTIEVSANTSLVLQQVKLQAFRMSNSTDLTGSEYICMEDSTVSNVVPIAVGCALAGLIIIVLIAYIIGRLRRRPYEPV